MVDEIAFAVKSCFAGLSANGFDFIQGFWLGLNLSKAKISSWHSHDFIKQTEKEITFRQKPIRYLFLSLLRLDIIYRDFERTSAILALNDAFKTLSLLRIPPLWVCSFFVYLYLFLYSCGDIPICFLKILLKKYWSL